MVYSVTTHSSGGGGVRVNVSGGGCGDCGSGRVVVVLERVTIMVVWD